MTAVPLAAVVITTLLLTGVTSGARRRLPVAGGRRRSGARSRDDGESSRRRLRRSSRVGAAAVAAWCDDLARCLRHGSTLRAAIATTIPADDSVALHTASLRHRIERGAAVSDASDGWSTDLERVATPGTDSLRTLAAALSAMGTLGGNTAEPIDRFATAMRQRESEDLERTANSAQARMSARVLTVIPLALLAVLLATDDDVRVAVTSPAGAGAVGVGLALNAIGACWMRRIATPTTERSASW